MDLGVFRLQVKKSNLCHSLENKMKYTQISNIEQFDLIEEKFGVALKGIAAEISDECDDDGRYFYLRCEITSLHGGKLEEDVNVTFSAFDSTERCVSAGSTEFSKEDFMGIDIFRFEKYVRAKDIAKIRVFITRC